MIAYLVRAIAAIALGIAATGLLAGELVGQVVSVHDGDTMTILVDCRKVRVRLASIDAPEIGQAFGRRSKDTLTTLCSGKPAQVVDQGQDRYGRTIGEVFCSGLPAGPEQVRTGMAWVFERYAPKGSPLYGLQAEAQTRRRGVWSDPQSVAPWEWRSRHHRAAGISLER